VLGLASHPQAVDQKSDVGALPPSVRVRLVEHEEAEIASGSDRRRPPEYPAFRHSAAHGRQSE
jgi:hypothetical protein